MNSDAEVPCLPSCSKASVACTCEYDFVFFAITLCDFAGFDFGFEELEDIDCTLIVEATIGVV